VGPPFVEEDVARSPHDGGGCGELLEAVVDTDGLGRVEREDEPFEVLQLGGAGDVRGDVGVDVGGGFAVVISRVPSFDGGDVRATPRAALIARVRIGEEVSGRLLRL
jgi:hypothetical protein